jgi:hypothetical protein
MARYEAGETLASIARTYDCSPPAISYIVSRSRSRGVAPSAVGSRTPASPEPQLVESHRTETPVHEPGRETALTEQMPAGESGPGSPAKTANETSQAALQDATPSNEGAKAPNKGRSERDDVDERNNIDPAREDHRPLQTLHLSQPHRHDEPAANGLVASHVAPGHKDPGRPGNGDGRFVQEEGNSKERGTFIDLALRDRVQSDIVAFLAAFDAALSRDTSETRAELREATDRLLRAGARTRIELERLEARTPLRASDGSGQPQSPWRQR